MKNQGITLIALVVTIIIMLILAGVTLNIALGDNGLFQMAKKTVEKYEEAANNESIAMGELENSLKDVTTDNPAEGEGDKIVDGTQLKIGDTVNYEPDKNTEGYNLESKYSGYEKGQTIPQEKYTWKVMNVDDEDGTVEIIGVPTENMKEVYLKGATGYNNGVYLLNEMCNKLYSNTDLGATARSINIGDIESHMNEKGIQARDEYTNTDR